MRINSATPEIRVLSKLTALNSGESGDAHELDRVRVLTSGWSRQGYDLQIGVAGGKNVAIDSDFPGSRVLDRFAVLGVRADAAGAPEFCEVGVAVSRAAQEFD